MFIFTTKPDACSDEITKEKAASVRTCGFFFIYNYSQKTYHEAASDKLAAYFSASRIARGKFSQLKEQAKENQTRKPVDSVFVNSQKQNQTPVNTTKELATELKTSEQTASRIIQIQAKAMTSEDGIRLLILSLACLIISKTL
jgi:hypothetical protein